MWKSIEIHKNQLATHQDRWNACIEAVTENSVPPDQGTPKTAWFAYSYFFEMESGGHEAYFYHLDQVIKEYGDERFLQDTEKALQTIGADQHAAIVRQYGKIYGTCIFKWRNNPCRKIFFMKNSLLQIGPIMPASPHYKII